jgi:hypothetical protein
MRKIISYLVLIVIAIIVFFVAKNWWDAENDREKLIMETAMIQKQVTNTSKLVVTEVKYAKVFTYEDTKKYGFDIFDVKKRALIIAEPDVQISYDLKQLQYELDAENRTIYINYIPEPELRIDPNISFYSIDDYPLNKFEAQDYNKAKNKIKAQLRADILKDPVMKNAQNRLLSELSNIYILSNSMGWKLVYNDTEINSTKEMKSELDL